MAVAARLSRRLALWHDPVSGGRSFQCGELCGETKKGQHMLDRENACVLRNPPRVGSKHYWATSFHASWRRHVKAALLTLPLHFLSAVPANPGIGRKSRAPCVKSTQPNHLHSTHWSQISSASLHTPPYACTQAGEKL